MIRDLRVFLGQFRPKHRAERRNLKARTEVSRRIAQACNHTVVRGPFRGMVLPHPITDTSAKLLGSYESELHAALQGALSGKYELVINIGCSDGFYAAGIGRLMPGASVVAYDTFAPHRAIAAETARANAVLVDIRERCTPTELEDLCGSAPTLIVCDCEGCENELIRPEIVGATKMIVELHAETENSLPPLFAETHAVELIESKPRTTSDFPELDGFDQGTRDLAVFERLDAQKWAVLTPH